jgi:hypothetical protein
VEKFWTPEPTSSRLARFFMKMATGQLAFQGATNGIVAEAILNRAAEPLPTWFGMTA